MKRKPSTPDQQPLIDPDQPPISISVRMVGGLSELVRNEASASEMDVSSWIRKACWDQLRDVEYGAMEKRLLASFDVLRSEMTQRQRQIWNAVSASFGVLLQIVNSDPNKSVDEEVLENAIQHFNQFRTKPNPAAAEGKPDQPAEPTAGAPSSAISFG